MSGEQDIRPTLAEQIKALRDRLNELERRVSGDDIPLDLSDINDVRVDSLGDATITLANGSPLVYRSADELWVPGSAGSAFPVGPYDDGANTYLIEPFSNALLISNEDDVTVSYANIEMNVDTDDSLITINSKGNDGEAYVQVGGSAGNGFVLLNVNDGASHPASVALDSSGPNPTLTIVVDAIIFAAMLSPIASGSLSGSQLSFWLDPTPGSTSFNIKAKDSGGTVRVASIALT